MNNKKQEYNGKKYLKKIYLLIFFKILPKKKIIQNNR